MTDTVVARATASVVPVTARRPRDRRRHTGGAVVNLLYVPALLVFGVFTVYPLVRGVQLSFTDWDGYTSSSSFVGLANYQRLVEDETFRRVLVNTVVYGVGSTLVQQVLGLALALALDRPLRGRSLARAVVYLPVLVSPVIMGTMYYLLLQYDQGALNDLVVALGFERIAWLSDPTGAVAIIVLVNSLQFVGLSMIIYLAGLQAIPQSYGEAASLDGASPAQQFWRITLPLLAPAIGSSVVLNLIGGLKLFDIITVLTNGGPGYSTNSVSTFIGITYFDAQSAGYASAMGLVLFLIILVTTIALNNAWMKRQVDA